jgi:hypothetical protein
MGSARYTKAKCLQKGAQSRRSFDAQTAAMIRCFSSNNLSDFTFAVCLFVLSSSATCRLLGARVCSLNCSPPAPLANSLFLSKSSCARLVLISGPPSSFHPQLTHPKQAQCSQRLKSAPSSFASRSVEISNTSLPFCADPSKTMPSRSRPL